MSKTIDHKKRKGGNYERKLPPDEETRQKKSEAMKEFNSKTCKITLAANALNQRRRLAKGIK